MITPQGGVASRLVIFRQFVDDGLGCASYLIGDEDTGEAAIVDPAYWIEQYLDEASHQDVRLTRVLETHTHADHLSGHGRLALDHGCPVHIHRAAEPEYPHEPLDDGTTVDVGAISIRTIHTPGHRPEHCAFAVSDRHRSDEPWLVLTGDSLFVGDAARPDLAIEARAGAEGLFHSLRRLAELPDGVEVYPGHVAGSLCGVGMSSKASSTIGFERRFNHAMTIADQDDFVEASAGGSQLRPPNMDRIVTLNRGTFVPSPKPLEPLEGSTEVTILDVRDADAFAAGHAHGAINVPVDGSSFSTKTAFLLSPEEQVAIHASSLDEAERAARGLRAVAVLDISGYALDPPSDESVAPIGLEEVERLLAAGEVEVLDVREKDERDAGYIAGTRNIPYRLLRVCNDCFGEKPVVTICNTGARAAIAASVLAAGGIDARPVLHGGINDWEKRGAHTVEFRRCGT
jgi:glyoxylase-like metal-dependent hydrolase (beta-lactamase superfamily II)/rhodanese-related sulfurtransferase